MKVAVRADASEQIGTGHVIRCLTLAGELRRRGANVHFIVRPQRGDIIARIAGQGFAVHRLPTEPDATYGVEWDHSAWRSVPEETDIAETQAVLRSVRPDWLMVDHYGLGRAFERAMRPLAGRILAIDDIARAHDCDVLLDQNLAVGYETRYDTLVASSCRKLLGPTYALLRPEYVEARGGGRRHNGQVRRVLVFFGGSDPSDLTAMTIAAMSVAELREIEIDVVAGENHPRPEALCVAIAARGHAMLHESLPHLAGLMSIADLGIGAGGSTTWERLCLGVPSVMVAMSDNQLASCFALEEVGIATFAGRSSELSAKRLSALVRDVIAAAPRLTKQSEQGQRLVDGLGVRRVAEVMA